MTTAQRTRNGRQPDPTPLEPLAVETIPVEPTAGPLAGRHLRMRLPSVSWLIAHKRGLAGGDMAIEWYEEIVDAVETHDLGRDVRRLPPRQVLDIGRAWVDAIKDLAHPPTSGSS